MNPNLLSILVCPVCKAELHWKAEDNELICKNDQLAFKVKDGIPVLIEAQARQISAEEVLS